MQGEHDMDEVREQQEAIRRSGHTNMADIPMVQKIAYESEFYALVNFIEEANGQEYFDMATEARMEFEGDELPDISPEDVVGAGR